ncbi:MAG: amidohydrolase family protein [Synergistaceae bacterium]|nr:amidohydrolase family protein [Synergistaceae bacterium]
MKVIDAHVHIYPPEFDSDRDKIAADEPWFAALTSSKCHKWGTAEELIASMDANGVERAFATSFAFRDQGLCRAANDYVLDAAKKFPGRILPLAVVSPMRRGAAEEIARCADAGAVGVGELFPNGQNLDITDAAQTWRLVAACDERGLFILFHTAEQAGHQYAGKGSVGAREAAKFCVNHPEARVVFAHFGGGLWAFESMPDMKLYLSNAYYDTAAMPWLYSSDVLRAVFANGAGGKLLFGSDWPILDFPRYEKLIDAAGLTEAQKTALLCGNADKLLAVRK